MYTCVFVNIYTCIYKYVSYILIQNLDPVKNPADIVFYIHHDNYTKNSNLYDHSNSHSYHSATVGDFFGILFSICIYVFIYTYVCMN
jgi:hypothetical protein